MDEPPVFGARFASGRAVFGFSVHVCTCRGCADRQRLADFLDNVRTEDKCGIHPNRAGDAAACDFTSVSGEMRLTVTRRIPYEKRCICMHLFPAATHCNPTREHCLRSSNPRSSAGLLYILLFDLQNVQVVGEWGCCSLLHVRVASSQLSESLILNRS
jgi:hypothetical protein